MRSSRSWSSHSQRGRRQCRSLRLRASTLTWHGVLPMKNSSTQRWMRLVGRAGCTGCGSSRVARIGALRVVAPARLGARAQLPWPQVALEAAAAVRAARAARPKRVAAAAAAASEHVRPHRPRRRPRCPAPQPRSSSRSATGASGLDSTAHPRDRGCSSSSSRATRPRFGLYHLHSQPAARPPGGLHQPSRPPVPPRCSGRAGVQ